jgi:hypothetical protein
VLPDFMRAEGDVTCYIIEDEGESTEGCKRELNNSFSCYLSDIERF